MADDEDEDRAKGEPLSEYIRRLETLSGTPRVRVPDKWLDKHGNLFLPPQAIYLVDDLGDIHRSADISGALTVNATGIGSGSIRRVQGTFTKDAVGSVGSLQVVPAVGDLIYFMYGILTIGGTRAGGTDQLYIGISGDDTSADLFQTHVDDAAAAVSEIYYFPSLGQANHDLPQATSGVYHRFQTMIPSISLLNEDNTAAAVVAFPRYLIELAGMANAETFTFALHFLSANNLAVTLVVSDGAVA